ncbi:MAG TPA: FG-GAP-like repeat-containing protein [Acidimicrobiia bacterium]|nr:FG-GAP-like repeat-containing protein [Acidimicrobiia bacterium]
MRSNRWSCARAFVGGLAASLALPFTSDIASAEGLFAPAVQVPVGRHLTDLIDVDVDRDSDRDLVVIDRTSNDLVVLRNQGAGTFAAFERYPVRTELGVNEPTNVSSSDFNGDGSADLAVSHVDEEVSLLFNDGTGLFITQADVFVGFSIRVLAADFNGDGAADLATTGGLDSDDSHNGVFVVLNDGRGGFGVPRQFFVGNASFELATADFDGDGDRDLAVSNPALQEIVILDNNGQGIFGTAQRMVEQGGPLWLTTADVEGDGDVDLVSANVSTDQVSVYMNFEGRFTGVLHQPTGDAPQGRIGTADFDGNGIVDLAVANGGSNDVSVFLGTDVFGNYRTLARLPAGDGANAATAADLTGDGAPEIGVANFGTGDLSIYRNTRPPLTVDAGPGGSGPEGSAIALSGSASDGSAGDGADATWSVTASTGTDAGASCAFADASQASTTVTCTDDGIYTLRLTVTAGLASRSDTTTVTVGNAVPSITAPTLSGGGSTACIAGNTVGLSFSVRDRGTNDVVTGTVDWGDGSAPEPFTGQDIQASHQYAPGRYTPTVTATDDDGGQASAVTPEVSTLYARSDFLTPISMDGSSTFQLGRKVPVKIQVTDCQGTPVPDLHPDVDLTKLSGAVTGDLTDMAVAVSADEGDDMRFDPSSGQYVFTLATRNSPFCTTGEPMCNSTDLTAGTYRLAVTDPAFPPLDTTIQIRER